MPARLRLLGPPRLEADGTVTDLPVDRPASLAYHLAVRGDWVRRSELAYLYYPDADESLASGNMRRLIHRLRQYAWASALEVDQTRLRLSFPSDAHEFRAALERRDFAVALGLYGGTFLEGVGFPDLAGFEAWLELEREELRRGWRTATLESARELESRVQLGEAELRLTALLRADPLDEDAIQALLRVLRAAGQRTQALEVFERFRADLKRELDTEPLEATRALADSFRTPSEAPRQKGTGAEPSPARPKHNLPAATTRFVGRKRELERLERYIANPDCRLLTLVGLGGMGKTRLALEAVGQQVNTFADGVWFVPLAGVASPDLLVSSIAAAVGLIFSGPNEPKAQLLNYLREKQMLLLLDNFEHLRDGSLLLEELIAAAPALKLMVTSRVVLELGSEWLFDLEGLSYPPTNTPEPLEDFDAVRLFVGHAERLSSTFVAEGATLEAIAELCRQVQGMPLALELAVSWTRSLSVTELSRTLGQSFDLLSTTRRDVPERQRNLHAILEYTWGFLSDTEQSALSRLSAFRGGFTLEAAQAVAGTHLGLLMRFINLALVRRGQDGRYDMHELVRQFSADKLRMIGHDQNTLELHLRHFLELAREAENHFNGSTQIQWKARIKAEYDNLLAALAWGFEHLQDAAVALVAHLGRYWEAKGLVFEGEKWLRLAISSRSEAIGLETTAKLHLKLLSIVIEKSDYQEAEAFVPSVEAWCIRTNDDQITAEYFNLVGLLATQRREFLRAKTLLHEGLEHAQKSPDGRTRNYLLLNLGHLATLQGDWNTATEHLQTCLNLARERGDTRLEMISLCNMAAVAINQGEYAQAVALSQQALPLAQQVDDQLFLTTIQGNLGYATWQQGDHAAGERMYREHVLRLYEQGSMGFFVENACELALFWNRLGFVSEAVQLWLAADQVRTVRGYPLFGGYEQIRDTVLESVSDDQQAALSLEARFRSPHELVQFIRLAARA